MSFQEGTRSRNQQAIAMLAVAMSILVYCGFVAYAEFHFYLLVTRFLPDGVQIVGVAAVAVTAITSIALPLAIHFWVRDGNQRVVTWVFYGIHLAFTGANLILDSSLQSGSTLSDGFQLLYGSYVLPASVIFYAAGWIAVWAFDSSIQRMERRQEVAEMEQDAQAERRVAVLRAQYAALNNAFDSPGAKAAINAWAARVAPDLLAAEMGLTKDELGNAAKDFVFWDRNAVSPPSPVLSGGDGPRRELFHSNGQPVTEEDI